MTLGFQPVQAIEDIGLSCLDKRQSRAQPVSPILYYIYHSIFRMKLKNLSLHIPYETKKLNNSNLLQFHVIFADIFDQNQYISLMLPR